MTDEILAYLMDDLPPERRAEVERRLATDPAWRQEKTRLEECLAAHGDPSKCCEEPPQDLVQRTCSLVEHADSCDCNTTADRRRESGAPIAAFTAAAPCLDGAAKRWTLADLTVGAGVCLIIGALVAPALYETRAASRRAVCEKNIQTIGGALFDYQLQHAQRLPAVRPGENAGIFVLALLESGLLTPEQAREALFCPESQLAADLSAGKVAFMPPTRGELAAASGQRLARLRKLMAGSYAYVIGYRDENGLYRQHVFTGDRQSPVLSDAPVVSAAGVRSHNHGGDGQNVLYQSGTVKFHVNCVMQRTRDHFFLNALGQQAAGVNEEDFVLAPSDCSPAGPLVPVSMER